MLWDALKAPMKDRLASIRPLIREMIYDCNLDAQLLRGWSYHCRGPTPAPDYRSTLSTSCHEQGSYFQCSLKPTISFVHRTQVIHGIQHGINGVEPICCDNFVVARVTYRPFRLTKRRRCVQLIGSKVDQANRTTADGAISIEAPARLTSKMRRRSPRSGEWNPFLLSFGFQRANRRRKTNFAAARRSRDQPDRFIGNHAGRYGYTPAFLSDVPHNFFLGVLLSWGGAVAGGAGGRRRENAQAFTRDEGFNRPGVRNIGIWDNI